MVDDVRVSVKQLIFLIHFLSISIKWLPIVHIFSQLSDFNRVEYHQLSTV